MAENKATANIDKTTAQQEAVRLMRSLSDDMSFPDISRITQEFIQQYTFSARKKILEAAVDYLLKAKGYDASDRLRDFLCEQSEDVHGKDLQTLAPLLMKVALTAGNDLPCAMLLYLLTAKSPKKPKEYLFPEQSLAGVTQDYKMGTPVAEVLRVARRDKRISQVFLKRWFLTLMPLVWTGGRPLISEEDVATILSVFQEMRKEEYPPELAVAVPAITALADPAVAERFLKSNMGKAFIQLMPGSSGIPQQQPAPPTASERTQDASGQIAKEKRQLAMTPETNKPLAIPAFESLDLRAKELLEGLTDLITSNKSEAQSLSLRLAQAQQKLQDTEKELNNLFQERANLHKMLTEEKALWNAEKTELLDQNQLAKADVHTLEEAKRNLSSEIMSLHAEMEQTARQHETERDNWRVQWVNKLLETVRPQAADVRDHILNLRRERPHDEAIRFLAISYYNTHRELVRMMGLNPETECLPQSCLNQITPE